MLTAESALRESGGGAGCTQSQVECLQPSLVVFLVFCGGPGSTSASLGDLGSWGPWEPQTGTEGARTQAGRP